VQPATPLAPVMAALKRHLSQGPVLQIDETPVQVLDEPGRANTTKSYMWVYRGGPPGKPVLWFQYAPSRGGDVPIDFLFPDGSGQHFKGVYHLSRDAVHPRLRSILFSSIAPSSCPRKLDHHRAGLTGQWCGRGMIL
jgi:hypothetical protein